MKYNIPIYNKQTKPSDN